MEHFKKELEELQNHTKRAHFKVGEDLEQETIRKNADELVKFRAEVLSVTKVTNLYISSNQSGAHTPLCPTQGVPLTPQSTRKV